MALRGHSARTVGAQLNSGEGMYGVVDAIMPRHPAAQQLVVGSIYNCICRERCDVATPKRNPAVNRDGQQVVCLRDTRASDTRAKHAVLHSQKVRGCRHWLARVYKRPKLVEQLTFQRGQAFITKLAFRFTQPRRIRYEIHNSRVADASRASAGTFPTFRKII
jgi:hypothetical protein